MGSFVRLAGRRLFGSYIATTLPASRRCAYRNGSGLVLPLTLPADLLLLPGAISKGGHFAAGFTSGKLGRLTPRRLLSFMTKALYSDKVCELSFLTCLLKLKASQQWAICSGVKPSCNAKDTHLPMVPRSTLRRPTSAKALSISDARPAVFDIPKAAPLPQLSFLVWFVVL